MSKSAYLPENVVNSDMNRRLPKWGSKGGADGVLIPGYQSARGQEEWGGEGFPSHLVSCT